MGKREDGFYIKRKKRNVFGPLAEERLQRMWQTGELLKTDKVSISPKGPWTLASQVLQSSSGHISRSKFPTPLTKKLCNHAEKINPRSFKKLGSKIDQHEMMTWLGIGVGGYVLYGLILLAVIVVVGVFISILAFNSMVPAINS